MDVCRSDTFDELAGCLTDRIELENKPGRARNLRLRLELGLGLGLRGDLTRRVTALEREE